MVVHEVQLVDIAMVQRFSIGIRLLADCANRILSLRWSSRSLFLDRWASVAEPERWDAATGLFFNVVRVACELRHYCVRLSHRRPGSLFGGPALEFPASHHLHVVDLYSICSCEQSLYGPAPGPVVHFYPSLGVHPRVGTDHGAGAAPERWRIPGGDSKRVGFHGPPCSWSNM